MHINEPPRAWVLIWNTAPLFGHGQPLVLKSPNLQPPLLMEAQGQSPGDSRFKLSLFD